MITMESYKSAIDETEEKTSSITPKRNKQVLKKTKRKEKVIGTVAGVAAAAVLVTGIAHLLDRPNTPTPNPDPISDPDIETDDKEVIDSSFKYALVADFDAEDNDQIMTVADEITANTKATSNVENIIKTYNAVIQKSDFSSNSDVEIFEELRSYAWALYNDIYYTDMVKEYIHVSNYLQSDKELTDKEKEDLKESQENLGKYKVVTPSAILGNVNTTENKEKINEYLSLIAKEEEKIQNYNEKIKAGKSEERYNKKIAKSNAKIKEYQGEIEKLKTSEEKYNERININLEKSLTAIIDGDMESLSELAQEFYDIYKDIRDDSDLKKNNPERWKVYIEYFKAMVSIYGNYLEKESKDIDEAVQAVSYEELFKSLLRNWDVDIAEIMALLEKDGNFAETITLNEEKYNKEDSTSANNSSYATGDDTKTEEKHGEQASGSKGKQETIKGSENLGTTTEKEETLPTPDNPPKDNVQEGGQEVGDPVIEDKPGEVIDEEDVPPEVEEEQDEVIGETEEVYVDADGEEFDSVMTEEEFAANSLVKSLY